MILEFEWDERKNSKNKKKHGVSFKIAEKIFGDELKTIIYDYKNSKKEDRWKVYGRVGWILYLVNYTERYDRIRIISARKATKKEEEDFYNGISTKDS